VVGFAEIRTEEAEEEIVRLQERYGAGSLATAEGVWILDHNRITAYVSTRMAAMLGYAVGELVGRPVSDFVHNEELDNQNQRIARWQSGDPTPHEARYQRTSGEEVWAIVSGIPLSDGNGEPAGGIAVFTSMTEQQKMARVLRLRKLAYRDVLDACLASLEDPLGVLGQALKDLDRIAEQKDQPRPIRAARAELSRIQERIHQLEEGTDNDSMS
jgi:PAS domain S-box-containing protein